MEILSGSGLLLDSIMKRKRSRVSRKPRANFDTLFQSYFGVLSLVEPFGKNPENESQRDTIVASDGVGTESKLKKLKLKFRGVTRTIRTKPKTKITSSCGSLVTKFPPRSDDPKPLDNTDGNDDCLFVKRRCPGDKLHKLSITGSGFTPEDYSHSGKTTGESVAANQDNVRKSKCIPKRHAFDVGFSDEENEDSELHFLGGFNASKVAVNCLSDGSTPTLFERKRGELSDMEQQLKKAEAAQRRKLQSEKAAKEAEAKAIRKILGQESGRKKKEEKMKRRRDEFAKKKSTNSFNLGSNTVRWTMNPTGTVVTFSEDIGLPSILQMVPISYPPPREKCAGPNCTNVYKYRDSKSKLPLCSLDCYRAVHEKIQPVVAC